MRIELDSSGNRSYAVVTMLVALVMMLPVSVAMAQSAPTPDEIEQMIDAGDFVAAESALAISPENKTTALLRAELYRRTDRDDEAYCEYQKVAEADPMSVTARFWLATIDRWNRRYEDSIAGYTTVLELSECNRDSLKGRARIYTSLDYFAGAEADLQAALECNADDDEAIRLLADLLAGHGNRHEAAVLLRQAYTGVELEERLGDLELSNGNAHAARGHFRAALELSPDDPNLIEKLADAERELGNDAVALSLYEKAAEMAGDEGDLYWIGHLSMRLGDLARAESAFGQTLERNPTNSEALMGMARIRRSQKRTLEAIEFVDRVLERSPTNGEALVLRGTLRYSVGLRGGARDDFLAALAQDPEDGDAQLWLERTGPAHFITLSDRSSRSKLIEGLEDEGVLDDGRPIEPTRIEYITDSHELEFESEAGPGAVFVGYVSLGRDAVRNNDLQRMIYDFDVSTALVGGDQQISERWEWSWRFGGTSYDPRTDDAIEKSSHFRGSIDLVYSGFSEDLILSYEKRPFIQRGFAADTKFTIFEEDRATLAWIRELNRRWSLRIQAGASYLEPGDQDDPVNGSATLRWAAGGNSFYIRAGHDPFPARTLEDDGTLTFIDLDSVRIGVRAESPSGFRFSGDGTYGIYGETIRNLVIDGESVDGPLESNKGRFVIAELAWSPPRFRPFSIGVGYDYTDFDFRTSPYNTRDSAVSSAFIEFADDTQIRARYAFRAAYHAIDDNRVADTYYGEDYLARLEVRLGRYPRANGSYWIGAEGIYRENDIDEERYKLRFYLTVPF